MALKPLDGFPVTMGWLTRSGGVTPGCTAAWTSASRRWCSAPPGPTSPPSTPTLSDRADTVLDVAQIARWAGCLGGETTVMPIEGARHDVFLSLAESRERAYAAVDAWLDQHRLSPV